jgi:hypothetical protein
MKLLLLILSIVVFIIFAIIAIAGGSWDTPPHLDCLLGIGLAFFAGSFLPIP